MNLKKYRMQIVGLGFAVSVWTILGLIPNISVLGDKTKYLLLAVVALGAYTWFTQYHQRAILMNQQLSKGFTKTPDFNRVITQPRTQPPIRNSSLSSEYRQPRGEPDEAGPGRATTTTSGRVAKPRKKDLRPIFDEFENVPGEKIR